MRNLEDESKLLLKVDIKQFILYKEMRQARVKRQPWGKRRDLGIEKRKQLIWLIRIRNKRASINLSKRILAAFLNCQLLALWTVENTIADQ